MAGWTLAHGGLMVWLMCVDRDPYLIDDDLNTLGGIRGYWHIVKPMQMPSV